jgi:hypothetical protein
LIATIVMEKNTKYMPININLLKSGDCKS